MGLRTIYQFADKDPMPVLSEVGGKGFSLIRMSQAGLAIPPGFVLAVSFFQPWINDLKKTAAWYDFLNADKDVPGEKINAVKQQSKALTLNSEQQSRLDEALALHPQIQQYAVRSSSPEEDLDGASFAGGYETVLGVTPDTMTAAIKQAFASCLDSRIFVYKKEQGFATNDFSIAVVIMEQVASEVAGVGFSVNPISNDYDEVIFNANWGLGETVVAGLASPDQFVVNKISRKIIEKQLGTKETAIWLLAHGGTEERPDPRQDQFSLTDEQILELTEQLYKIEQLYKRPMDIEWAYAHNQLYLLQARPITTWIPLPEGLTTKPEEPRRLYLDLTLSVQGLAKPVSVLGLDVISHFLAAATKMVTGRDNFLDIKKGLVGNKDGKLYLNLSNVFTVISKDKVANALMMMDAIASEILYQLEPGAYQAATKPQALEINKFALVFRLYDVAFKVFVGKYCLKRLAKSYDKHVKDFTTVSNAILAGQGSLSSRIDTLFRPLAQFMIHDVLFALLMGIKAIRAINTQFAEASKRDQQVKYHLDRVSRSLPHNITIEMGLDIYKLSTYLDKNVYQSVDDFLMAFANKQLPLSFYEAWNKFLARFGCRGPEEFDMASPRYSETPKLLLLQIYSSLALDATNNPLTIYEKSQEEREIAYEFLFVLAKKQGRKALRHFKSNYAVMMQFGGYRENHKYFLISLLTKIRQQVLAKAQGLVAKGVLKDSHEIFDLKLADLRDLEANSATSLQARRAKNTEIIRQLQKVKKIPPIIDSRGRVLGLKRQALKEGELGGHAVSSGTAKGRVKVLHSPDEKPLLVGEILVARATDPGWTPLFVNAAAIVLEVGGLLQHGALVAREYGKPCVAGVENATSLLKDGQLIEVDGALGIIRILSTDLNHPYKAVQLL